MCGNVALSADASLLNVPVSIAGPCQPLPTSTDTFPDALKAMTQAAPVVHVAEIPTPDEEIFTPGNGT